MSPSRLLAIVLVLTGISLVACNKRDVAFKAAFVTERSGVQSVARVKFYLLSKDLKSLERESGQRLYVSERQILLSDIKALATEINTGESNIARQISKNTKPGLQEQLPIFQSHVVSSTTTDFDGTGSFENVPKGIYFLTGYTTTKGGGIVAWSLKIDTESMPHPLVLDHNNTIEFEDIE